MVFLLCRRDSCLNSQLNIVAGVYINSAGLTLRPPISTYKMLQTDLHPFLLRIS